jgi:hypothetical protein
MAWLESDLTESAAMPESKSIAQREAALKRFGRWHVDPALAALRDEACLDKLSDSERRSLLNFWSRVELVRATANSPGAERRTASRNP